MNFARPLIVSDIPENLEVSKGIASTFRREDPSDLARAIRHILDMDESERQEMGRRGRDKVENLFTWELVTDQVEELYQRLLG